MGDTKYKGRHCDDMSPKKMEYLEGHLSQMVISEAAATCFAEQLSYSRVGTLTLNEQSINEMFNTTDVIKMDTTSIAHHLPLF